MDEYARLIMTSCFLGMGCFFFGYIVGRAAEAKAERSHRKFVADMMEAVKQRHAQDGVIAEAVTDEEEDDSSLNAEIKFGAEHARQVMDRRADATNQSEPPVHSWMHP